MRFWYIVWQILSIAGFILAHVMVNKIDEPSAVIPAYLMLMSMNLLVMPILLIHVLNIEGKTQLWLYNPQSSYKLLMSKLSASAVLQLVSQSIFALMGYVMVRLLINKGLFSSINDFLPLKQGFYIHAGLFSTSVYMGIWVVFLWCIYHSLGKYPAIRNFRWLAVLLVWGLLNVMETFMLKLNLFNNKEFSFNAEFKASPNMDYETGSGWFIAYDSTMLPIPLILYYIIVAIALFFIASRLLDKKVEV